MANPILARLMGNNGNNLLGAISQAKQIMRGGSPEQIMSNMMQTNPQFRQFMQANQGKTPEQISADYGIDLDQIRSLLQ